MKLTVSKMRDLEKQVIAGEISYSRMVEIINETRLTPTVDFTIYADKAVMIEKNEPSVTLITVDLEALKEYVMGFWYWWYNHNGGTNTPQGYDQWFKSKEAQELLTKFHTEPFVKMPMFNYQPPLD